MRIFISRRFYHLFGLQKFIVVATEKHTGKNRQFVVVSRKAKTAIQMVSKQIDTQLYDLIAYTKVQYTHMMKLNY